MPYRRLPNTDQARIRALKAVVVKGDICNVYDLAVSLKALTDARNFLTKFEARKLIMPTVLSGRLGRDVSIRLM